MVAWFRGAGSVWPVWTGWCMSVLGSASDGFQSRVLGPYLRGKGKQEGEASTLPSTVVRVCRTGLTDNQTMALCMRAMCTPVAEKETPPRSSPLLGS